jgi:hypothetical protein
MASPAGVDMATEGDHERRMKTTFSTQAKALSRKNVIQQRRALWQNFFIIITPIFFVLLLYVLQKVINNVIQDDSDNQCGCLCSRCCIPVEDGDPVCRDATLDAPCNAWEDCKAWDETQCGLQYSNAAQASVCEIPSPSIWPPLFQVPSPGYLAHPESPDAAILMTGVQETIVNDMQLFPEPDVTDESIQAVAAFAQLGQATDAIYAGFPLLGVQLGTFQKEDLMGYHIEFGFLPDPPDVSLNSDELCLQLNLIGFVSQTRTWLGNSFFFFLFYKIHQPPSSPSRLLYTTYCKTGLISLNADDAVQWYALVDDP